MGHIFISFVFYNILLLVFYSHYRKGHYYIKKSDLIIFTILLIAFGTYGGGEGDYLHYKERVELYHSLYDVFYYNMMEIQYNYLAYYLDGNYNLWRLVIFSIQFIGMSWFLYKAKMNTYPVYLCFISYCLILSVYNRAGWGPIYFFMGVYLLIEKKNPLFLFAIALCYVSHTQNLVLLTLIPLAFFDLKKWHIVLALLLFGTLVASLKESFNSFLDSGGLDGFEGGDYISDKAKTYSQSSLGAFGNSIGEYLIFILRYVPMALFVLLLLKIVFIKHNKYLSFYKPYRSVINITIGAMALSFVVLFASLGGGTFYYRILGMLLFPMSILLPYMLNNGSISKKTFNIYILCFIVCSELNYFKDLYYTYAHGNV